MRRIGWTVVILATLTIGQAPPGDNIYTLADGSKCQPQGDDSRPALIALDLQKNRPNSPKPEDVDSDVTLGAILSPGNDIDRFDATRAATIEGIVVRVKEGSKESCNCHASEPIDQDTHIELALSDSATPTQRIVVEVTPRLRKQMKDAGTDWSNAALSRDRGTPTELWESGCESPGGFSSTTSTSGSPRTPNPGGRNNVRAHLLGNSPGHRYPGIRWHAGQCSRSAPRASRSASESAGEDARPLPVPTRRDRRARNDSLLKKYGEESVREAEEEAKEPPKPEEIKKARSTQVTFP